MGGRYQTIQVDFSGCSPAPTWPLTSPLDRVESFWSVRASRFSPGVLTSVEPPGVLGAPNEAKAPVPSAKADEALVEGDETPAESGEIALNGFERPWELSGPKRLDGRGRSTRAPSLPSVPDIESDNLEELLTTRGTQKSVIPLTQIYFPADRDDLLCPTSPQVGVVHSSE